MSAGLESTIKALFSEQEMPRIRHPFARGRGAQGWREAGWGRNGGNGGDRKGRNRRGKNDMGTLSIHEQHVSPGMKENQALLLRLRCLEDCS